MKKMSGKILGLFCIALSVSCSTTRQIPSGIKRPKSSLINFYNFSLDRLYMQRFDGAVQFNVPRGTPGPLVIFRN